MTRRTRLRATLAAALAAMALVAIPIAIGYLEGPRFPVLDPGPWGALKKIGREWRLAP